MNTIRKIRDLLDGAYDVRRIRNDPENVMLICDLCDCSRTYTMRSIRRFLQNEEVPTCKSLVCKPVVPEGFELHSVNQCGIPKIACDHCHIKYINYKLSKKYSCYCQLKTKADEYQLYCLLQQHGLDKLFREVQFNRQLSSHKCDLMARTDTRKIYIELDGREHYGSEKDIEFNTLFYNNRTEDEYLVRIRQNISLEDREELVRQIVDDTIVLPPVSYQRHSVNGELVFQEYAPVIAELPEVEIIDEPQEVVQNIPQNEEILQEEELGDNGENIDEPQEVENNPLNEKSWRKLLQLLR